MDIQIKWFDNQFNVGLASKEGAEPFVSIKGCRIVDGTKGPFVSYPATKGDNGKWWNHVWGNEKFNATVLSKAQASMQSGKKSGPSKSADPDEDIPF